MTIAVIPARRGSKAIPSKNIRVVAGHPLVHYAIKNAMDCDRVDLVIVTTDDPVVASIAEALGARVHWRSEDLAGDLVTLDPVVVDAVDEVATDTDTVVTLQPTSPCLTVDTLRRALDEFNSTPEVDTMVSVVNKPKLRWAHADGRFVPLYQERLNRQRLPACLEETGAFVIAKAANLSHGSRFYGTIRPFETPETEAIDIDDPHDMILAAITLSSSNNFESTFPVYHD